jgi:excisionase family DNA binding protein
MPKRISSSIEETEETWLSLQTASKLLGVHPATLRQWADQGRIHSFRTPGGHRRFAYSDVASLVALRAETVPPSGMQLVVQSALGRAHLAVADGRLTREPWYQHFDEEMKARHRELGRSLLGVLLRYLSEIPAQREPLLDKACAIGAAYGADARAHGLSMSEVVSAFLLFRDFLLESVIQGEQLTANLSAVHGDINHFVNSVMLAMLEHYESVIP